MTISIGVRTVDHFRTLRDTPGLNASQYVEHPSLESHPVLKITVQPVLHFGIMRFVYDFKTDSRKKKNHLISFPHTLDMSPYLSTGGKAVYTLQGILRHKGVSAYRGHYEAQVRDE